MLGNRRPLYRASAYACVDRQHKPIPNSCPTDPRDFEERFRSAVEGYKKRYPALSVDIDAELAKYRVWACEERGQLVH